MEVYHLILGNPRELAYKFWRLDEENINQLLRRYHDRYKQREAKTALITIRRNILPHEYTLKSKKSEVMKRLLDQELLPDTKHLFLKKTRPRSF